MDGSSFTPRRVLLAAVCAASVLLQGCDFAVPTHAVGYWQQAESYFVEYQYNAPGADPTVAHKKINSCMMDVPTYLQCSGHGVCKPWAGDEGSITVEANATAQALKFCRCNQDWADPDCSTPRKSQSTAFVLSMFGGFLGLDLLYLGFFFPYGALKLATLGGLGVWWIYDIVRIGSSPVNTASSFKVANNVPHWAFVLSVLTLCGALAFVYSAWSLNRHRIKKQREVLMLQAESAAMDGRSFTGYGSTLR